MYEEENKLKKSMHFIRFKVKRSAASDIHLDVTSDNKKNKKRRTKTSG